MDTKSSLTRRVEQLEAAVPGTECQTCAARPVFTLDTANSGGTVKPCGECGREPFPFTISIDRAERRAEDAA
jgi:hypothetical protein